MGDKDHRVLLRFKPPFLWYSSVLRRDGCGTRGEEGLVRGLVRNLAEGLGFSSISVSIFPNCLREWGDDCSWLLLAEVGSSPA